MTTNTTATTTTSRGTTIETTVETVETLRRSQVVFVTWMEEACQGLSDTDLVEVRREHAGFMGTFVLGIKAAN